MAASLGTLTLDLVAKIGQFVQPIKDAEDQAKESMSAIEQHAEGAADSIKGMIASGAGLLSLGALFAKYIQNTRDAEQEQAQLAAVLKSTGEAAGYSQDQLNDMANSMSQLSILSGGEINQAQTSLLAFTGIVGDQFPRALQAAIDMSARTGMSVVSAAETIGRALDVPSKGLTALSKQGFRFTEDQKALAEQLERTGNVAEAQGIILDSLESSYKGAAEATRNTFDGALAGLNNTFDDLLTGDGSLQVATNLINNLSTALASPAAAQGIQMLTVGVVGFAAAVGGRMVASTTASAVAFINAQREAARYNAALAVMAGLSGRAATSQLALGAATRGASAFMGVLGGPVGLVATIGLTAASYLILRDNADASNVALETSAKYAGITAIQFKNLSDAQKDVAKSELEDAFKTQNEQLEIQSNQFSALTRNIIFAAKQQGIYSKNSGEFIDIQRGVEQGTLSYTEVIERLNKLDFMTVEQKKQLLDAVTAYNNQYAEVTKTNEGLKVFGEQSKIAGSAAQNSATGITAQGQAAQAAAGQVAGLTEELDRLLQQSAKTQASSLAQTTLIGSGYAPGLAKALADAAIASGGNLSGKQAEGIIASYNAQQKLNSATETYNKKIQDGEKARQKIDADRQKSQQKTEDELKRRGQEYQSIINSLEEESVRIDKEYSKQKDLIEQFATDSEKSKQLAAAYALAQQKQAELGVQNARNYNAYFEFENTRADLIETHYEQEKVLAQNNAKYTKDERQKITEALERQKQKEIEAVKKEVADNLKTYTDYTKTEAQLAAEKYAQMRDDVIKFNEFDADQRKQALDTITKMEADAAAKRALEKSQQDYSSASTYAGFFPNNNQLQSSAALQGQLLAVQQWKQQEMVYLDQWRQENLDKEQEYQTRLQAIKDKAQTASAAVTIKHAEDERTALFNSYSTVLSQASTVWGSMTDMVKQASGESSAAYKLMFFTQQAIAMAQAVVNTELAATQALTLGPILGVPAATLIRGLGYASVGLIAGQTIAGMAHSGIDSVPQDGTWLLQKGERVTTAQTSAKLDRTLDQVSSSTSTGNVYINNYGNDTVSTERNSNGDLIVTIQKQIDSYVPAQLAKPNSSISRALSQNTQTQRRR